MLIAFSTNQTSLHPKGTSDSYICSEISPNNILVCQNTEHDRNDNIE